MSLNLNLTLCDMNKMANILQTTFSKGFFLYLYWSKLVQLMAWHQTGNKQLPALELMMTQFTDACVTMPHRLTDRGRDKMADMFADDIFKCIFLIENISISLKISLKFVPKIPIIPNY